MTAWLVIVSVGVGTYIFRAVLFVMIGDRALPAWTNRPLSYVGPAAIAALVGGSLLVEQGRFSPAPGGDLVAVATTFVFVQRTRHVALGLVIGFAVLWCFAVPGYAG
jgi:branched-subunit amino acid transport protein